LNDGVAVTPVHFEFTPSIVTLTSPVVGDKTPLVGSTPLPVTEY
jgi:hypothetical protein